MFEEKVARRQHYRQIRRSLIPEDRRNQEASLNQILLHYLHDCCEARALQAKSRPLYISAYYAVTAQGECSILPSIEVAQHKAYPLRFFLPRVEGKTLCFAPIDQISRDIAQFVPGSFQIPEPPLECCWPDFVPDLVLLPCLAVDYNGKRLGQGGGYYDRCLAHWRKIGHSFLTIAIAYNEQFSQEALPCEPHDEAVDAVCLPSGLLFFDQ